MDVRCGRDLKDRLYKGESEGVAHGVDKHIRDKGLDGFVGKNTRAKGLADCSEMRIARRGHPIASIERDGMDCLRVQGNVETALGLTRTAGELLGRFQVILSGCLQSILPR